MQNGSGSGRTVIRKVMLRLLPFTMLLYFIAYVDRANVSIAALQMNEDLEFSNAVYGLGAGIFFIGYFLFEVPSNLILERMGARKWLARIMFTWGVITVAFMFVNNATTFYALRFLLGVAEAGLYPGVVLYLTYWFPSRGMGQALAWFQLAAPLSLAVSTPVLGALLGLDGLAGLAGWQWLFLITGIPPLLLTFATLRYLTDTPDQAGWLTREERTWLIDEIRNEREQRESQNRHTLREALLDSRVWLLSLAFFSVLVSFGGIVYFLPQIIEEFSGSGDFVVSLLSAIPWIVACVGLVLLGRHSDRTGERRWHAAGPYLVGVVGLLLSTYLAQPFLALTGLVLVVTGIQSAIPGFWGLATTFLSGTAAAGALALINSVGNLGGFVGPYLMGLLADATGSQRAGLFVMSAFLLVGAVLILLVRPDTGQRQTHQRASSAV